MINRAVNSNAGDSFYNNGAIGATASVIVSASSNVNGIIVHGHSVLWSASGASSAIATGASAPTSTTANENILFAVAGGNVQLGHDVFIPPGNGLWAISAVASDGICSLAYKVL